MERLAYRPARFSQQEAGAARVCLLTEVKRSSAAPAPLRIPPRAPSPDNYGTGVNSGFFSLGPRTAEGSDTKAGGDAMWATLRPQNSL